MCIRRTTYDFPMKGVSIKKMFWSLEQFTFILDYEII